MLLNVYIFWLSTYPNFSVSNTQNLKRYAAAAVATSVSALHTIAAFDSFVILRQQHQTTFDVIRTCFQSYIKMYLLRFCTKLPTQDKNPEIQQQAVLITMMIMC